MTTTNANALTARWASTVDDGGTALSGAGVYVLLALLGPNACGPARDELLAVAPEPLEIPASPTARMATAVWSRAEIPLTEAFTAAVPQDRRGPLTGDPAVDQPALDAWASEQTRGAIPAMPIRAEQDTLMVLASALSVRTAWAEPFDDGMQRPETGPWAGRDLAGLHRRTRGAAGLGALRVADTAAGPVTLLTVAGAEDVDVVLALGEPDRAAGAVLPAAITALAGTAEPVGTAEPFSPDRAAPGVTVREVEATDDTPELVVSTVRFTVRGAHDLLKEPELFGLRTATDDRTGHFPGISPVPMSVSQARQDAVAEFTASGFEASAVTAFAMRLAGAFFPERTHRRRVVTVAFDRPFGFAAVHRATGLVLVAGWVAEPERFQG
ncbi:serpin family protein [Dactylosporangium sp. NPDC000244]|uniref:serpin family protein n=1 Tax=Dactylosporangium sp. NPDC000244 TaxID=3154365 RepID=UPI00332031AB